MSVKLPQEKPVGSKWVEIRLGGGQCLQLLVNRPTFAQQVACLSAVSSAEYYQQRISASITDWREVEDNGGQTIPFSLESLWALCGIYPQALARINEAVTDVWVTYPGDLAKNSPPPPATGGMSVPSEIAPSIASSNSAIS